MFLKFKYEFKKYHYEEAFFSTTEIIMTDFFTLFNTFSTYAFTEKLRKYSFKKINLISFELNIVLNKMKEYSPRSLRGVEGRII